MFLTASTTTWPRLRRGQGCPQEGILTHREGRVLVRDERRNALKMCVVFALGAIARPIRPLTGLRLWMGRLLGGLFSHAGGTDALRKARQRSRTMGGPMGPVLYRRFWTHGAQAPHDARLLSIALTGHYPSPSLVRNPNKRKKRDDQMRNRCDSNNRAAARYYPSPISQVRKERRRAAAQVPFFTTLVTALLATRQIVLFYLCKTKANSNSLPQFFLAWLASFGVIGSSTVRLTSYSSQTVYARRSLDTPANSHSLRSTGFRRHLSAATQSTLYGV